MKLGLIGASKIARRLLPVIREVEGIEVVACASKDPARLQSFTEATLVKAAESYEKIFQNPDIQAVYISVLNADHPALVEQALHAGKHVLCEKPLTLRAHDASRLFEIAHERNLVLLEALMYRFHPQIIAMVDAVRSGKFGKTREIRADFFFNLETHDSARRTPQAGGGAVEDLGCYPIDFVLWVALLLGDSSDPEVTVFESKQDADLVVETCLSLSFTSGLKAIIRCGIDRPSLNVWEICTEAGTIVAFRNEPQSDGDLSLILIDDDSKPHPLLVKKAYNWSEQFKLQFENFRDAIERQATPHISAQESIRTARVLEQVRALNLQNRLPQLGS
jgi:predicted dehydrogenase